MQQPLHLLGAVSLGLPFHLPAWPGLVWTAYCWPIAFMAACSLQLLLHFAKWKTRFMATKNRSWTLLHPRHK